MKDITAKLMTSKLNTEDVLRVIDNQIGLTQRYTLTRIPSIDVQVNFIYIQFLRFMNTFVNDYFSKRFDFLVRFSAHSSATLHLIKGN